MRFNVSISSGPFVIGYIGSGLNVWYDTFEHDRNFITFKNTERGGLVSLKCLLKRDTESKFLSVKINRFRNVLDDEERHNSFELLHFVFVSYCLMGTNLVERFASIF